jgi:hypothetical protein
MLPIDEEPASYYRKPEAEHEEQRRLLQQPNRHWQGALVEIGATFPGKSEIYAT